MEAGEALKLGAGGGGAAGCPPPHEAKNRPRTIADRRRERQADFFIAGTSPGRE
jgi:hypothetical protein